jgi:hypothetical protein
MRSREPHPPTRKARDIAEANAIWKAFLRRSEEQLRPEPDDGPTVEAVKKIMRGEG